jgi:cell division protein FtsB
MFSRLFFNPISFILVTVVCLLFSISLYKSAKRTSESAQDLAVLEKDIETMEQQLQGLREKEHQAEQPFTKEEIIRNELLMQKPGEYVVQIPETMENSDSPIISPTPTPWEQWKALLL